VSDTFPRNLKVPFSALLLLLAAACLSGCPLSPTRPVLVAADESMLEANGDKELSQVVRNGGKEPFAVIVVFRESVFLGLSSMLDRSSHTLLNEFGNTAILLLRPGEVVPLLKTPSVLRIAWFGAQGRLARIEPTLELDLLDRFGKGTDGKELPILARFRSVPQKTEERRVEEAGFRILTREGANLVVSGPMSRIPRLLDIEWIVYIEKGTGL
jgi:hypothetical protein